MCANERTRVRDENSFEEMRQYLIDLYCDMTPKHSFLDHSGQIIDCIPIRQQPSLRGNEPSKEALLAMSELEDSLRTDKEQSSQIFLSESNRDSLGNTMYCPAGMIPFRRITLDSLTLFETVDHYHTRGSRLHVSNAEGSKTLAPYFTHRYAEGRQVVKNFGAGVTLGVFKPELPESSSDMSLSQVWVSSGNDEKTQTLEGGWQVYPSKYGTTDPVLFILWTPDDYAPGGPGGYNLDKPGFVQTNHTVVLGSSLSKEFAKGSGIIIYYILSSSGKEWILYFDGTPVGYYPTDLFKGGALTSGAERIDFGGETATAILNGFKLPPPPMGNGKLAGPGSASQWGMHYYIGDKRSPVLPKLTIYQETPKCYTADDENGANTILLYGGPGGDCD
jgi:hypothetical protein